MAGLDCLNWNDCGDLALGPDGAHYPAGQAGNIVMKILEEQEHKSPVMPAFLSLCSFYFAKIPLTRANHILESGDGQGHRYMEWSRFIFPNF